MAPTGRWFKFLGRRVDLIIDHMPSAGILEVRVKMAPLAGILRREDALSEAAELARSALGADDLRGPLQALSEDPARDAGILEAVAHALENMVRKGSDVAMGEEGIRFSMRL